MTAVLSIQPSGVPALLSDCVISGPGLSLFPTISQSEHIPDELIPFLYAYRGVHRKIYTVSQTTAIACSGDDDRTIRDLILDVRGLGTYLDKLAYSETHRPMDVITEISNSYNGVGIVGLWSSWTDKEKGDWVVNDQFHGFSKRYMSPNFSTCTYSGSGWQRALAVIKHTDNVSSSWKDYQENPGRAISALIDGLNFAAIDHAANSFRDGSELDWGGLFEALFQEEPGGKWRWMPPRLQLFSIIYQNDGGYPIRTAAIVYIA